METACPKDTRSSTSSESKTCIFNLYRGGCALVWLARSLTTGDKVALKQFPKQSKGLDSTA